MDLDKAPLACPGFVFLGDGMHEDQGSVLAGPRRFSRSVGFPENLQKSSVRNDPRIEIDLDRFRMVAEIMICRVRASSPRVTDARSDNSIETPEPGVGTPESAECERCGLQSVLTFSSCRHVPSSPFA